MAILLKVCLCFFALCTANNLYINSNGCDNGLCSVNNQLCTDKTNEQLSISTQLTTCQSIEYAYNCLMGIDESQLCKTNGYNGFGSIYIDIGNYNLPPLNTSETIQINGKGATVTHLIYVGVSGEIFNNIHFNNIDLQATVITNSNIQFINCSFNNSSLKFLLKNNATMAFIDCIFENNVIDSHSMFSIESGSLIMQQTQFKNNIGSTYNNLIYIYDSGILS
eukprot:500958_1